MDRTLFQTEHLKVFKTICCSRFLTSNLLSSEVLYKGLAFGQPVANA
jgi:hypothetical protein